MMAMNVPGGLHASFIECIDFKSVSLAVRNSPIDKNAELFPLGSAAVALAAHKTP